MCTKRDEIERALRRAFATIKRVIIHQNRPTLNSSLDSFDKRAGAHPRIKSEACFA